MLDQALPTAHLTRPAPSSRERRLQHPGREPRGPNEKSCEMFEIAHEVLPHPLDRFAIEPFKKWRDRKRSRSGKVDRREATRRKGGRRTNWKPERRSTSDRLNSTPQQRPPAAPP